MREAVIAHGGLDLPFVPFTFPTASFCSLADEMGFDISYTQCQNLLDAYEEGRANGRIPKPGNTRTAADYMASVTWYSVTLAENWLKTADAAVTRWWGDGYIFPDFGGQSTFGGVVDDVKNAVGGVTDAVGDVAGSAINKLTDGISKGLGLPKFVWIGGGLALLILAAMVYLKSKTKGVL